MTQREQFEAWARKTMPKEQRIIPCDDCRRDWGHGYCGVCRGEGTLVEYSEPFCEGSEKKYEYEYGIWQAAQAANNAELQKLREKLAKCREFFELEVDTISHEWNTKFEAAEEACGL